MIGGEEEQKLLMTGSKDVRALTEGDFKSSDDPSEFRIDFVRKVYAIFFSQVLSTTLLIFCVFKSPALRNFMVVNWFFLPISVVVALTCLYTLVCFIELQRKAPLNYLILFLFTVSEAYAIASFTTRYDTFAVLVSASCMVIICLSLNLYALTTTSKFTRKGATISLISCLVVFGVFMKLLYDITWLRLILNILAVFLFGLYLISDTKVIIGNKSMTYSSDDYIAAALNIYLDIIGVFMDLLTSTGKK